MCTAFTVGRKSTRPLKRRKRKGSACAQCTRREAAWKRRIISSSERSGGDASDDPAIHLPATLLPVAHHLRAREFKPVEVLRALVAIHMREDSAQWITVVGWQRPPIDVIGDQRVG